MREYDEDNTLSFTSQDPKACYNRAWELLYEERYKPGVEPDQYRQLTEAALAILQQGAASEEGSISDREECSRFYAKFLEKEPEFAPRTTPLVGR